MIGSLGGIQKAHLTVNTRVAKSEERRWWWLYFTHHQSKVKRALVALRLNDDHDPPFTCRPFFFSFSFSTLTFFFYLNWSRAWAGRWTWTARHHCGGTGEKRCGDAATSDDRPTESIILIIEAPTSLVRSFVRSFARSLAGRLQNLFSSLEYNTNAIGQSSTWYRADCTAASKKNRIVF